MEIIVMAVYTQGFTSEGVDLLANAVNKTLNINSYKLLASTVCLCKKGRGPYCSRKNNILYAPFNAL